MAWMCRLLHVPRSSFYAWRNRAETAGQARRLGAEVGRVFAAGRGAYGCRRVTVQLNREGHDCSVGLVADLMRELGLAAVQPRAYKRTTVRGEDPLDSPDLVGRDFATGGAPGQRLVGDMPPQAGGAPSYLRTGEGWLYLATVLDLATRMVVGWQTPSSLRTVPLGSVVTERLAEHLAQLGDGETAASLFTAGKGQPVRYGTWKDTWKAATSSPGWL